MASPSETAPGGPRRSSLLFFTGSIGHAGLEEGGVGGATQKRDKTALRLKQERRKKEGLRGGGEAVKELRGCIQTGYWKRAFQADETRLSIGANVTHHPGCSFVSAATSHKHPIRHGRTGQAVAAVRGLLVASPRRSGKLDMNLHFNITVEAAAN